MTHRVRSTNHPNAAHRARFPELNALPLAPRLGRFRAEIIYWGHIGPQKYWRNYLHTHSFYEVCYAYTGAGTFEMLGKIYNLRSGDLFIAKPGEPHEIIPSRKQTLGIHFWSFTLVKDRGSSRGGGGSAGTNPEDAQVDALLDTFESSREWVSRRTQGIRATLDLLNDEIVRKQPGYAASINGLTAKLLLDTARSVVNVASAPGPEPMTSLSMNASDAIVRTAVRYLRDNYSRPITLRDVAAQVHLSERHLSRLFLKRMGMSIVDHLTTIRIDAASQLLLAREMPIKRVSHACGYPDVHYFTTLFKRKTGLTPAAFRQTGGTKFLRKKGHVTFD